jgi:hypothetical protein
VPQRRDALVAASQLAGCAATCDGIDAATGGPVILTARILAARARQLLRDEPG